MLETEISEYLVHYRYKYTKKVKSYKNRTSQKKIKSNLGKIELDIPRKRNGEVELVVAEI